MQNQIFELSTQGKPIRAIAKALGVSRNTVRRILRESSNSVQVLAQDPEPTAIGTGKDWRTCLDWDEVLKRYQRGRSKKSLHEQYISDDVSYWAFRRALLAKVKEKNIPQVTTKLHHVAGEKTFVDYCDGISICDVKAGTFTKTHLFCGVLPFSSRTFGEFVLNQKLPSFIESHERMWSYFGGVTPYVVIDNLKSGVHRAHLYDPDINPTYCDFANHSGFAVLPARPRRPRDKAAVEAAIGVIQRTFYQEVSERKFYSLAELNLYFRNYLDRLNAGIMKDYGVSREERFLEEKDKLLPLPSERYEFTENKEAIVHPDGHIQVHKNFYSVPYNLVSQTLRVRISRNLVEVFTLNCEPVTAHERLYSIGKYSTMDVHIPEIKKLQECFDLRSNLAKAKAVGPKTFELVETMFSFSRPLRYLRRVQGMMRLLKDGRSTPMAMEYAAGQALTFQKFRLGFIAQCSKHYMAHGNRPRVVAAAPTRDETSVYLHNNNKE